MMMATKTHNFGGERGIWWGGGLATFVFLLTACGVAWAQTPTTVTLVLENSSISENRGVSTVTASVPSGSTHSDFTVTVSVAAVSPAVVGDFTLSTNRTLTIGAGSTMSTGVVTITARDNNVDAPDKGVTVSGTVSDETVAANPAAVTLMITDDDAAPTVMLRLTESSISENGGTSTVSATLGHPSSATTTVMVLATAVSPAVADDFTLSENTTLTIGAGLTMSTGTVTITAKDNPVDAPDKGVTVSGTVSDETVAANPAAVTLMITDDEGMPTVTLMLSPASISENGGTSTVSASLDHPSSEDTRVTVTSSDAFTLGANAILTIPAESTGSTGTVTITARDNAVDAPDKRVTVSATATNGQGIRPPTGVTLTITDDDAAPTVTLMLSSESIGEGGEVSTVTASLDVASSEATTVTVSAMEVSPAVAEDFTLSETAILTIPAESTMSTGVVTITARDNDVDAPNKSVTVSATVSEGNVAANPADVTLTIIDNDDAPTVTLILDPPSINEGGRGTVTATLSHPSSIDTKVVVSAMEVSPAVAEDFALSANRTLTIPAESTGSTGTVTITARDNAVDAPDKRVTVSATVPEGNVAADLADVTLTIVDNDTAPTVTLMLSPASIDENEGVSMVTASLDVASSEATTVTVSAMAVSPAMAGDFALSANRTLTIAAGLTTSTGTVTITARDNTVDAPNKSVTVSATATNTQGIAGDPDDKTLMITDDEGMPTVTLMLSPASIGENEGVSTVTAALTGASSVLTTVTVSTAPGDNTNANDFMLSTNRTLTIAAGSTTSTQEVTITAVNNDRHSLNRMVTVSATVSHTAVTAPDSVVLTITEDEPRPTVTLRPDFVRINEARGVSTVSASLDVASSEATTVTVSAMEVSPAVATDFTLSENTTLTIPAGSITSRDTMTITANDNLLHSSDKMVSVSGTAENSVGVTDPQSVTVTIINDEATPTVRLHIEDADGTTIAANEEGETATVTATLDIRSSAETVVEVTVSSQFGDSLMVSENKILRIAAGSRTSTGTVTITLPEDDVYFGFLVQVQVVARARNSIAINQPQEEYYEVLDNDPRPIVTLMLSDNASIDENGGMATVTARLNRPAALHNLRLTVLALPASSTAAADFTQSENTTLRIAAGSTMSTRVVTITANDNDVDSPNKLVRVSGVVGNTAIFQTPVDEVTLTIRDDDVAPVASLHLSPESISESGGLTTVTATLDHPSSEDTTVRVIAEAVSGEGSSATDEDFTLGGEGVLTIPANSTNSVGLVRITANDNLVDSPDKTVTVSGEPTNAHGIDRSNPGSLIVDLKILDDDETPTVSLMLSIPSITEDSEELIMVTATLDHPSSRVTTVTVSAVAVSPAMADDFTLSENTTLTIGAGLTMSTGTVTIAPVNNDVDAQNKRVTVSADVENTHGITGPSSETLEIIDDEGAPTVRLMLSPSSISEAGGVTMVTATLTSTSSAVTKVTFSLSPDHPALMSDYTLSGGNTLTIEAGSTTSTETVTITAVDNTVDAPDKTVEVSATVVNAQGVSLPSPVMLTIKDDDVMPTVTLELDPSLISESGGFSIVTAMLDHPSSESTTVTVSAAAAGTQANEMDFVLRAEPLIIAAGSTISAGTVRITARDNDVNAPNKMVVVSGMATNGQGIMQPEDKTLTIEDDDDPPTVTLELDPSSISESGGLTRVTATLNRPSSESTTVTVSAMPVGEAVAGDFTLSANTTLTIAAGLKISEGAVTITANDNDVDAPDKRVTVSATATNTKDITPPDDVTLTITDNEGNPTVMLHLSPSSISEDGGVTMVTAVLTGPSSESTTVTVSASAVRPAVAGDFTLSANKILTFAAGSTMSHGTVTITANDNNVDAPDKTVMVSGTVDNAQGLAAPLPLTLRIEDDDATPTVTLSLSTGSISEATGSGSARVTATLDHPSSAVTTVAVVAEPGDLAVATDFTQSGSTLTIAAGLTVSTGTVTITAVDNDVDAPNKMVRVVASTVVNLQGAVDPQPVTLTIEDDEGPPTVTLELDPTSIGEDRESSRVTARLNRRSSAVITVTVSAVAVSPAVAGDFTLSGSMLTIAARSMVSTGTVTIRAVNNNVDALDKMVRVTATAESMAERVTSPEAKTLIIKDDDEGTSVIQLSVSPGTVDESGGNQRVTVTAKYDSEVTILVDTTVTVMVMGDTASADDFYAESPVVVTIPAGSSSGTHDFMLRPTPDTDVESDETVTVSGTAEGFTVSPAEVTIIDDTIGAGKARTRRLKDVSRNVLPQVTQAMMANTVTAVTGRIEAVTSGANRASYNLATQGNLAGALQTVAQGMEQGNLTMERLLGGSSFVLPLTVTEDGQGAGFRSLAVWGRGDYRNLSGDGALDWEGDVFSAHLGADVRLSPAILAGLAASWSNGSFDYTDTQSLAKDRGIGSYETRMTSVHPYVNWSMMHGVDVWASLGYGGGTIKIAEQGESQQSSDTTLKTAAVGATGRLLSAEELLPGGTTTLRLKGESLVTQITVEGNNDVIEPLELDARRFRLALEGSYDYLVASGERLVPAVEVGVRHDGGEGLEGTGLEVGGGLRYVNQTLGLTVDGRGRALVTYGEQDYKEWGASVLIRLDPGVDGQGLSFNLAPTYGQTASGVSRLWDEGMDGFVEAEQAALGRLEAVVGYGLPILESAGLVTPYSAVTLSSGERQLRLGGRLGVGSSLEVSLEGAQEVRNERLPVYGVRLRVDLRF